MRILSRSGTKKHFFLIFIFKSSIKFIKLDSFHPVIHSYTIAIYGDKSSIFRNRNRRKKNQFSRLSLKLIKAAITLIFKRVATVEKKNEATSWFCLNNVDWITNSNHLRTEGKSWTFNKRSFWIHSTDFQDHPRIMKSYAPSKWQIWTQYS